MVARNRCLHHRHSSNMALSSGCLVTSIISPCARKGAEFCLSAIWGSLACTGTYYIRHQAPQAQHYISIALVVNCHFIMKERWWRLFFPKLCVCIKDNNNSPHGKFHRFLFPFSSTFSELNFTSYVLYIYLCYVTCHTQWAWVTYDNNPLCKVKAGAKLNGSIPFPHMHHLN